jgi:hypothetical protein
MGKSKIRIEQALLDQVDRSGRPNPERVHYRRRRSFATSAATGSVPGGVPLTCQASTDLRVRSQPSWPE